MVAGCNLDKQPNETHVQAEQCVRLERFVKSGYVKGGSVTNPEGAKTQLLWAGICATAH
jgi:hypothetical protein